MTEQPTPYPLRFEQGIREALDALAKANNRKLSQEINFALRNHISGTDYIPAERLTALEKEIAEIKSDLKMLLSK